MAAGGGHGAPLGPVGALTTLGAVSSWMVLLLAAWGGALGLAAARAGNGVLLASAARAVLAQSGLALVSLIALGTALARGDFNVGFVAAETGRVAPALYRIGAMAFAPGGIALMLACAVPAVTALVLPRYPAARRTGLIAGTSVAVALLALFVIAWARPFARLPYTPLDGAGLDWRFRHPGALVEAGLVVGGWSGLLWGGLARLGASRGAAGRAAGIAWVLLSGAMGIFLWRWYATLAPGGGELVGARALALAASWLAAGGWLLSIRTGAARGLVAAGILVPALWLAGLGAGPAREVSLAPGDTIAVPRWGPDLAITHSGVSRVEIPSGIASAATIELAGGDETASRLLVPERRNYFDVVGRPTGVPLVRPAVAFGMTQDVRVELVSVAARGDRADYRVRVSPAVWLLGLGLALAVLGALVPAGSRGIANG